MFQTTAGGKQSAHFRLCTVDWFWTFGPVRPSALHFSIKGFDVNYAWGGISSPVWGQSKFEPSPSIWSCRQKFSTETDQMVQDGEAVQGRKLRYCR
jgi:hypothetical protein